MSSDYTSDDPTIGDAWGEALLDHLAGRFVDGLTLEVDDGTALPAMHPEWFFRPESDWEPEERQLLACVVGGPVLDLGAGAGRSALHLQEQGYEVTAIESSPGAVDVCRRRGVRDVRAADLNDPPADKEWHTILLLCGNLGLGGSWDGNRRLLRRIAEISRPGAVLIADSVNYSGDAEIGLRIRYGETVTPWWRQCNVAADEVEALVDDTGWRIEQHLESPNGFDHYIELRRE
jgi:SAM-dependent methyltransferase